MAIGQEPPYNPRVVLASVVALPLAGVTFSAPAEPASRLIPELGKASGLKMEAAPAIAREVLLVHVKNMPMADLTRRIAQVTGGEWEENQGVYRLALAEGADARERRAEATEKGETWRRALGQRIDARAKGRYSDGSQGLVDLVLSGLPPATLGALGFKERVVFSTHPSPMQRPLSLSALRGVDLTKLSPVQGPILNGVATPAPGPVALVEFAVQSTADETMLVASLVAADANGRVVGATAGGVWNGAPSPDHDAKLPVPEGKVKPSEEERTRAAALASLDASPISTGAIDMEGENGPANAMYSDSELNTPSASKQVPEILQPESVDPLALTAGPLVGRLAEAEGRDVVADLPDAALVPARSLLALQEETTAMATRAASRSMQIDVSVEGDCLLVRPHRPWTARMARLDRAALGTALRALATEGSLSLDAQAAYASAQPIVSPPDTFEGALFGVVSPSYGKRMLATCTSGERQLLRVYRAMGPLGKEASRPFGRLPASAQTALRSLVFDSLAGPSRTFNYGGSRYRGSILYGSGPFSQPWTLELERTDFWSNGIPRDTPLAVFESSYPATFGLAPSGARPNLSEGMSGYSIRRNGNGPPEISTTNPRLSRYAQGTIRRVVYRLTDPAGVTFTRSLQEEWVDPSKPILAFGDLPEGLRRSIEDSEERVRKSIEQSQSHSGATKP